MSSGKSWQQRLLPLGPLNLYSGLQAKQSGLVEIRYILLQKMQILSNSSEAKYVVDQIKLSRMSSQSWKGYGLSLLAAPHASIYSGPC